MAFLTSRLIALTLVGVLKGEPLLTSYPVKAEEGKNLTLICTTSGYVNIWYINWKRNGADIFGMGPDTGLAETGKDFEELGDRVVYEIKKGEQYNVTLISVDPEKDHGSTWNCRVNDEESNTVIIKVGDLPLGNTQTSLPSSSSSSSSRTSMTSHTSNTISQETKPSPTSIGSHPPTNTRGTTRDDTSKDALTDGTTDSTPQLTLDFALIAIGGIGGIVFTIVAGFCIYGAIRKRRKRLY